MNLIWRGKKTLAYESLKESAGVNGTYSKLHCFSYTTNEDRVMKYLLDAGFVKKQREQRLDELGLLDMPRDYYYATQAGLDALAQAEDYFRGPGI